MKNKTRQKLIDATFDEVFSHGYQGAALADILAKAEVHKGSMYHYFANKKEMALTAVKEKISEKFFERYSGILELKGGYLETFFKGVKDTRLRDLKRGCPIANLIQEMSNLDEDFNQTMKEIYDAFREYIQKILDAAITAGEFKPCDTKQLALFITATLEGAILSAKASGDIKDYENVVEVMISYVEKNKI